VKEAEEMMAAMQEQLLGYQQRVAERDREKKALATDLEARNKQMENDAQVRASCNAASLQCRVV